MITTGIYWSLYNMLSEFIFGSGFELTEYMDLTLTILSICGCLFVVSLPFVLVWRVIKMLGGS